MLITMRHYAQRVGKIVHVTNAIGPYIGQHHVHTADDFKRWANGIDPRNIDWATLKKSRPCDCGLKPGQVKAGGA